MPHSPTSAPPASTSEPIEALLVEVDDNETVAPPSALLDLESEFSSLAADATI